MDNASKALIMAGAILLAVAIVGLGVYFFSMSEGLTDQAGDSITNLSTDLQNSELLKYEGSNVRGKDIHTLARHLDQIEDEWAEEFEITVDGGESDIDSMLPGDDSDITAGHVYTVTMGTGNSGFVRTITITDNAN